MRVLVRLIASLLGLAVAAVGALLMIEAVWTWLEPAGGPLLVPWRLARAQLGLLSWSDGAVRASATALVVVGLVLLTAAATARGNDLRLHDPAPSVTAVTDMRSLARLVGHRVRAEEGVAAASVTASRKRVRVRARSEGTDVGDLPDRLFEVLSATVGDLPLRTTPKVSVSVTPAREGT